MCCSQAKFYLQIKIKFLCISTPTAIIYNYFYLFYCMYILTKVKRKKITRHAVKKREKKRANYIHNLYIKIKILMRKQGYFFKNDSNFGNHDCREVRHEYRDRYSLARDVTSNRKRHGHGEGFRLADVHLRLFDIYKQLKRSFRDCSRII